jgi:hypothetical protein
VSPQLLPRPSTGTAKKKPGRGKPAPRPAAKAVRSGPQARNRVLRRPAVLALVAGGGAVLAGLGWTFLSSSRNDAGLAASAGLTRPTAATPSPSGATTTTAPSPDGSGAARNPFGDGPAAVVTAPTTSPHVVPTPALVDPASAAPAPSTVTVTVTAPGAATYVGLYGWNGNRASFRVNARTYSVHVGAHFGPDLVFGGVVGTAPRCAQVTYADGSVTLCPGQVTALS